jgi:hypothetical protein
VVAASHYRHFQLHLENVPLQTKRQMWIQYDLAPPHVGRKVRLYQNANCRGRWAGRSGPVAWPTVSSDLCVGLYEI